MPKTPKRASSVAGQAFCRRAGFTFVEIVVALGIGAAVIVVSVMAFGAIGRSVPTRKQTAVNIGLTNMVNFYKLSGASIAVSEAPNFASAAMADSMRNRLLQDISSATAVCCLARNEANVLRPTNLTLPSNLDARTLVSPEQFRTRLIDSNSIVYTNFNPTNSYNGATTASNLSIYVLSSTNSASNIQVQAIYETDFVTVTNNPSGVYATVRRYVGDSLTDYYHVFYPGQTNNAFLRPLAAYFTPSSPANGDARYRQAANRPFYMVWWPDPARKTLASSYPSEATNSANARGDYMQQAGVTPYYFVIPAFPSL